VRLREYPEEVGTVVAVVNSTLDISMSDGYRTVWSTHDIETSWDVVPMGGE